MVSLPKSRGFSRGLLEQQGGQDTGRDREGDGKEDWTWKRAKEKETKHKGIDSRLKKCNIPPSPNPQQQQLAPSPTTQ